MAITPEISLGVYQQRPFDPIQTLGQVMQLRNAQQQNQAAELDLAEKQKAISESDKLKALFTDPTITDEDTLGRRIMSINPTYGISWQKGRIEQKKAALELKAKQSERLGQLAGSVSDEKTFHSALAQGVAEGVIPSEDAQRLITQGWTPETQTYVKQYAAQSMDAAKQLDEQRKALIAPAELSEKQAKADQATRENAASKLAAARTQADYRALYDELPVKVARSFDAPEAWTPDSATRARVAGMTPDQQMAQERSAHSPAYKEWQDAVSQGYKGGFVQYQNEDANRRRPVNVMGGMDSVAPTIDAAVANGQGMGEDALKGLDPQQQNLIRQMVDYKRPIPTGVALTSGDWPKMLLIAHAYDPAFDEKEYAVRQGLRKDMTSGKSANNIKSFNTAIRHLETFKKAADALGNGSFTPMNAVGNTLAGVFGGAAPNNFMNAANAVEAEAATAFKGTSGTDQEIKQWRAGLSPNMSPAQIAGAVKTITELLAGRIAETSAQYERGMGKPKDFHFLSDDSRKLLTNMGVDVDKIDPMQAKDGGAVNPQPAANTLGAAQAGGRNAAPVVPKVGETRTANGETRTWDGSGWVHANPPRGTTPRTEYAPAPKAPAATQGAARPPAAPADNALKMQVQSLLKGQKPGTRHTLSDGSVWDLLADGSVMKVK